MKKVYFVVLICFLITFKIMAAAVEYRSASATGLWNTANMWSQSRIPVPANLQNDFSIYISSGADVTHAGNLTFDAKGSLIVNGVLVIDGDLVLNSNSHTNITINTGGILIVTGDFIGEENNTSVNSGGYLVVGGDYIHTGTGTSSITNPGNIFTMGQVESGLTGNTAINKGEDALRTKNLTLYNFVKNRTPGILPVTLLYFKATAQTSSVDINWASAKAWDFSHYELERSEDGKEFYQIAAIDAEENSNETVEYSYTDNAPLAGTSYYRLKAVDIDGKSEYKGIEMVKFGAETFEVYPNPSSAGYVAVKWSFGNEGAVASLKDNTGRTVRTAALRGQQSRIETADLPAGMYLLVVQGAAGVQKTQVMIR